MKKTVMMGLVGLVLGIGVAVGTATVGSQEAAAAPCCSSCEGYYDACAPGCNGDAACLTSCQKWEDRCWGICSFSC